MGREKRISDTRAKEIMDDKAKEAPRAPERSAAAAAPLAPMPKARTSTGKAIFEIILLYFGPVALIYVLGKFVFKL